MAANQIGIICAKNSEKTIIFIENFIKLNPEVPVFQIFIAYLSQKCIKKDRNTPNFWENRRFHQKFHQIEFRSVCFFNLRASYRSEIPFDLIFSILSMFYIIVYSMV